MVVLDIAETNLQHSNEHVVKTICVLILFRYELIEESMLEYDESQRCSVVGGWLSAVKINQSQVKEMLSFLRQ